MQQFLYLYFLFCCPLLLVGQPDSLRLTKDFRFTDGVYERPTDWQHNQPTTTLPDDFDPIISPRTGMLRMTSTPNNIANYWGITHRGVPYIRIPADSTGSPLPTFAPLKVRGKICYFTYETTRTDSIPFAVYNPRYGYAFRRAKVERTQPVQLERMLHFETLELVPFNRQNLLRWTESDRAIYRTIEWIREEELSEKLYKALLVFDDRHPVYLPQ